MAEPASQDMLQYLYCAVCLECTDLRPEPQLAITIVSGTAACEEHRRRVAFSFDTAVRAARKFYQEGPRNGGYRNGGYQRREGG